MQNDMPAGARGTRDLQKNESCREISTEGIARAHSNLIRHGYAVVSESDIEGFAEIRMQMAPYFSNNILKKPENDTPSDRKRARDVIRYEWDSSFDSVLLAENDNIIIRRPNGDRDEYSRVWLLENPSGYRFAVTVLSLIPECWRHRSGTLGVNLLRTFTNVVTKPHQEHFGQFAGIWVINKAGDGAETYLYDLFTPGRLVLKQVLTPGELVIFNDELFLHGTTPLKPVNGQAQRDAVNFAIHFSGLY